MVKFWYKRIKGDPNRLDEVPKLWRKEVKEMIELENKEEEPQTDGL